MPLENIKDVNFIVLCGKPNAGKTTTLNKLIIKNLLDKITDFNAKTTLRQGSGKPRKSLTFNDKNQIKKSFQNEEIKWTDDVLYKFKYKEKNILVITEGDDFLKLLGTLVHNFLLYNKTDIVICAAREEFYDDFKEDLSKIVFNIAEDFAEDLSKIGFNIADEDKLEKKKSSEKAKQESDNQKMSEEILKKIDNLIQKSGNIKI